MPESISHYTVIKQLGAGAMGEVYLARDPRLDRNVAIKLLRPGLAADEEQKRRFQQEAKSASALNHPNILTIYDVGSDGGRDFIAMEFVEGQNLRQKIQSGGPVEIKEFTSVGLQLASALARAHKAGIVHRDLKPDNVMIRPDGIAKILDFGLAKLQEAPAPHADTETAAVGSTTTPGMILGTPRYMSPEQARGQAADHRADIFSLGCILHEMATGSPPFLGESAVETMTAIIQSPAPPLNRPADPWPEVERVLHKCLAKDPDDRYQHADDIEVDLRRVRQLVDSAGSLGSGLSAVSAAIPAPTPSTRPRRRRFGALAIVSVLAIVAVLIGYVVVKGGRSDAATTPVTVVDEQGREINREVPRSEFRKRLAVFLFESPGADSSDVWLAHGLPTALAYDLMQDVFLAIEDIMQIASELNDRDIELGQRIPLTLQKEIAGDAFTDHFLAGSITERSGAYTVQTTLYETKTGKKVQERAFDGRDLFAMLDQISLQVRQDIGVSQGRIDESPDLPISEIFTDDLDAFRHFIEGLSSVAINNDWPASVASLERATQADPRFTMAHMLLAQLYVFSNRTDEAKTTYSAVMLNLYRLPESLQFAAKSGYYELEEDPEKQFAVVKMWAELYPADVRAQLVLGQLYTLKEEPDEALEVYRHILDIDPKRYDIYLTMGNIHRQSGRFSEAEEHYRTFADEHPQDLRSFQSLGELYSDMGDYAKARESYEKCLVIEPEDLDIHRALARIESRLGEFDSALESYEAGLRYGNSQEDTIAVLGAIADVHETLGQIEASQALRERAFNLGQQHSAAAIVILRRIFSLDTLSDIGREDEAFRQLEKLEAELTVPWNRFGSIAHLEIYERLEDPDGIERSIPAAEAAVEATGWGFFRHSILVAEGRMLEMRGDFEGAVARFQETLDQNPTEDFLHLHLARCYRKMGKADEAMSHFDQILKTRPFGPEVHYELALFHHATGKPDDARRHMNIALDVWKDADPAFKPAEKARAKLAEWDAAS